MRITSIIYATAVTILIGINALVCQAADMDDRLKLASDISSSTNLEITANDLEIPPLPRETFTKEVSDLLSPDIFSQANPLAYLLAKVKNLPHELRKAIKHDIFSHSWSNKFPPRYTPYVELASSFFEFLFQLRKAKQMIEIIQSASRSDNPFKLLNMSIIEPSLSPLFSPCIFSDNNPPLRLFSELLAIPENEISNTKIQLQNLLENRLFPRRYFGYVKSLLVPFNFEYILRGLKSNIAKTMPTLSTQDIQHDINSVLKNEEFDRNSADQLTPETKLSIESDTSPISKSSAQSNPDFHQVVNYPHPKYFSTRVVKFLSPDMFSQTNLVIYFLLKASKLNRDFIRDTCHDVSSYLDDDEFPPHYVPYAQFASSLLSCLMEFNNLNINNDIRDIRSSQKMNSALSKFDISKFDPELSALFSPEIMSTAANPSILLLVTLINIPEIEIPNVVTRMKNIENNYRVPRPYRIYNTHLRTFLDCKQYLIFRLKDDIAEMQRIVTLNSSSPTSQQISYIKSTECLLKVCPMS